MAEKLAEKLDRPLTELVWHAETELRSYAEMAAGTAREALAFNDPLRREGRQPRIPHPPRRAGHRR